MTWSEITAVLTAYKNSVLLAQKQRAIMDHAFIGMLGKLLDGKEVGLYESYPALFKEESKQAKINQVKQRLLNYAAAHNKGGAKKNDVGKTESNHIGGN